MNTNNHTLTVNQLPVPTWNRMNANNGTISCPQKLHQDHTGVTISGVNDAPGSTKLMRTEKSLLHGIFMPSAMGDEAAAYVEEHASERMSLAISGVREETEPIMISYTLNDSDLADVLEIRAEEGSRATVIVSYRSTGTRGGFHGNLVKLYAKSGAFIRLIQVQMLGTEWTGMDNVAAVCEDRAEVAVTQIELGAGRAFSGCRAELTGYQSRADIRCYYIGNQAQELDFNYVVRHLAKKTKSSIDAHGILMDRSSKILRGTIDFPTGCARSSGSELETVLLLNPEVKNVTVPLILCTEEDVEGSHGATIGNLSQEQLFYLKCRGLRDADIRQLMAQSLTEAVCREALDEGLAGEIRRFTADYLEKGGVSDEKLI